MEEKKSNTTDHLANERTFLAWLRTGVGIMAFGFVVVKFTLFIKQVSVILGKEAVIQTRGYSAIVGIILVAVGTITFVLSYIRYRTSEKQINEGQYHHSSVLITVISIFIFLVSLLLIAYLVQSTKF